MVGWERRSTGTLRVRLLAQLLLHHYKLIQSPHHCRRCPDSPLNLLTYSTKNSDPILSPANWTPWMPWLHLEILSIRIINRISDKGQPWLSPTLTGNRSDLLLAMQTGSQLPLTGWLNVFSKSRTPRLLSSANAQFTQPFWLHLQVVSPW